MRWHKWNWMKHGMLWLALTGSLMGCGHQASNEFFCPPEVAYDQAGKPRLDRYAVDRACYKSMTAKQQACYAEVK